MRHTLLFLMFFALLGCSEDLYDCHIITQYHTFIETKLCDGVCSPMVKISNIKQNTKDKHIIVSRSKLKETVDAEYESANMVNSFHPEFIEQTGKMPVTIIKLECRPL